MGHNQNSPGRADQLAFDLAPPRAASLIESLRAFGYDLPSAIADLVDNSISANASRVWIDFHWDGASSVISATDDGDGMTTSDLVAAMRPGSQSPLQDRMPHDLGRFGLGLKTASFSQCRRVTVFSKKVGGEVSIRCWDLDHVAKVDDWQLLREGDETAALRSERLNSLPGGTCVVWQKLDRIAAELSTDSDADQQIFLTHAKHVADYLGMVFHRFLRTSHRVQVHLNNQTVEPWDPFLASHDATQVLPMTRLNTGGGIIRVRPFVLPHHSKLTTEEFTTAGGPRGWNAHQGFFVYRNRRLLVPGDWLGLGWSKEEHYKLARIRVDIPSSLDLAWEIDVTKSRASPPAKIRKELRRIGERTRADAKRVYSFRGAKLLPRDDSVRVFLWIPKAKHGKTFYRLNPDYPLLKRALASAGDPVAFRALIRLIEETVPIPHIMITANEEPAALRQPFERSPSREIAKIMAITFKSLLDQGYVKKEALRRLRAIFPFELYPEQLQTFIGSVESG